MPEINMSLLSENNVLVNNDIELIDKKDSKITGT